MKSVYLNRVDKFAFNPQQPRALEGLLCGEEGELVVFFNRKLLQRELDGCVFQYVEG